MKDERGRGPDFLVVGAQKGGTTWLAHQLRQHESIFIPLSKELHFLDWWDLGHPVDYRGRRSLSSWHGAFYRREAATIRSEVRRHPWSIERWNLLRYHHGRRSLHRYRQVFPPASAGLVRGELTPDYGPVSKPVVDEFLTEVPDLRVLLILRDPVARRWSNILHVLRSVGRRPDECTNAELMAILDNDDIGDYRMILDNWSSVPSERLKVLFYDDLQVEPGRFLDDVLVHLGLEPGWRPDGLSERVNVTASMGTMPDDVAAWAARDLADLLDWLVRRFPDSNHPQRWREQADRHR